MMVRLFALFILALPAVAAGGVEILHSLSGNGRDQINAIATDREGNIYLAGETDSTNFPVKDAAQPRQAGGLYLVSRDSGRTWTQLGDFYSRYGGSAPSASPHDARFLLASTIGGLARSEDGGATWRHLGPDAGFPSGGGVPGAQWDRTRPGVAYATMGTRLLRSTDFGAHWTTIAECPGNQSGCNAFITYFHLDPLRPGRIIHHFESDSFYFLSEDGGATWEKRESPARLRALSLSSSQPDAWVAYSPEELFLTLDAGLNWNKLPVPAGCISREIASRSGIPGGWILTTQCEVLVTDDHGATWRSLPLPPQFTGFSVSEARVDPFAPGRLIVGGITELGWPLLYVSEDNGTTWIPAQPQRRFNRIAFDPVRPGVVYASAPSTKDAFVTKLDSEGTVVFSTYLGGASDDSAKALSIGQDGAILVAGTTRSTDFPAAVAPYNGGDQSASFIARLDHTGRLERSLLLGGVTISALAHAPGGDLLLAGGAAGDDPRYTLPPLASPSAEAWHFFLRLDARDLSILHGRLIGGFFARSSPVRSVAADSEGNAYLVGVFESPGFPGPPLSEFLPEQANLLKFSRTGELLAARWLPSDPVRIAVDADDSVFIAGLASVLNPVYNGRIDTTCPHDSGFLGTRPQNRPPLMTDVSVLKFAPDLDNPVYEALLGGACRDIPLDMALDGSGGLLIAGEGYSDPLPPIGAMLSLPPIQGQKKGFYARLSTSDGQWTHASYVIAGEVAGIAGLADGSAVFAANQTNMGDFTAQPPWAWLLQIAPTGTSLTIDRVVNAFAESHAPGSVSPGEIVRLEISGFEPAREVNLWIAPSAPLPLHLEGIRVLWDGVPAPIMAVGRGFVVAIAPSALWGRNLAVVTIEVPDGRQASAILRVVPTRPAFYPDIRNEDGSLNSPENPAPQGSRVTFFFSGLGPMLSELPDGAIIEQDGRRFDAWIVLRGLDGDLRLVVEQVEPLVGFVKGLWAGHVTIDAAPGLHSLRLAEGYWDIGYGPALPLFVSPAP
jgi:uncharacterized protein (TIGR03437 family)